MKKYTAPSYDAKPNAPRRLADPTECEIRGCDSLRIGPNHEGKFTQKCGKADVFVKDVLDQNRGVCCYHYSKIVDGAGKGRLSCLQDDHGETTIESVKAHWSKLDADPFWEAKQIRPVDDRIESGRRQRGMAALATIATNLGISFKPREQPASYAHVALDLSMPDEDVAGNEPPAWWNDRP